ncbi:MAG: alpha/beta fold hydrolase [Candidatus Uhrbacteria bacterium]
MRIILIHGFNASPDMNFHPWLRAELQDKGFEVVSVRLDLQVGQELNFPLIMEEIKKQIGYLKNDDILLGHSLGALLMLQYLQAAEMFETPRAVILVAAPWKVSRPELRQLFVDELDADVIMWKAREFVVVHSKDDKMVPLEHGKKLAEVLRARFIEREADDHFMAAEYPVLRDLILEISNTPFEFAPGEGLKNDFE